MNHLPVYFVSHALKGTKLNYMTQENLALALVITTRKLRSDFLSHPITVNTNSALGKVAANPDASGRLIKWVTKLSEYDIKFEPRSAIKAQVLADFLAKTSQLEQEGQWKIFVYGSSCQTGKYEALLLGLKAARNLGVSQAILYSDSQIAIQQSNGKFEIKNEKMIKYARALDKFKDEKTDHLARLVSSMGEAPELGLKGREAVSQLEHLDDIITEVLEGNWRYDIHKYLTKGELSNDNKKAREIKKGSLRFVMIDRIIFKRSFSRPLLKCLGLDEANYVLREIHEGCCGNHLGSIALARKALLAGFFWPTMRKFVSVLVNSCYNCQRHANLQWKPAEFIKAVVAACSFDQWVMDIVGPFPISTGQRKFLLVGVDYFSKWVVAEPLAKITEKEIALQL
ncbi:uncharacterized protein [Henckelia pumila]|uniref:uncharacterized protein n=1 Tax=Henckelia pumila TaxID=405737 RepID=UPI003C6E75F4